jgi:hypothetical protein
MRRLAYLAVFVTLLSVTAPAVGEDADAPAPLALEGAPGIVRPPKGEWTRRTGTLAPGQWFIEFRGANDVLLRVHVFPALQYAEPEKVLLQAVDVFFRGMGVQGFGLPMRRPLEVWGCPAVEGAVTAVRGGARVKGRARLVRLSASHWGFAIGIAPVAAPAAAHDAVHDFARSLEPAEPRFYERRFHRPVQHEVVVVRKREEDPVTLGHVASVQALLEAGIGARFPLALWPQVREALRADAERGPPATRKGFRESAEALQKVLAMEPPKRTAALAEIGKRILQAVLDRAREGYDPAVRFAFAWREMRRLSIGQADDGLTTGQLAHLVEMSEFLASVAADRAVVADRDVRAKLHARLAKRWPEMAAEERKAMRGAEGTWAVLRYAWDNATAERRLAFRAAVAARLTPAAPGAVPEDGRRDARALKRWMDGRAREGLDAALLDAAFDLTMSARRTLVVALGVEDAADYHFGW